MKCGARHHVNFVGLSSLHQLCPPHHLHFSSSLHPFAIPHHTPSSSLFSIDQMHRLLSRYCCFLAPAIAMILAQVRWTRVSPNVRPTKQPATRKRVMSCMMYDSCDEFSAPIVVVVTGTTGANLRVHGCNSIDCVFCDCVFVSL